MKKISTELHLEGPIIRDLVSQLRELMEKDEVFRPQTKLGTKEYARETLEIAARISKSMHHHVQPARGLIRNLELLIGGTDEDIETAESLKAFFTEALKYAGRIERACLAGIKEAEEKIPKNTVLPFSRAHQRHIRRKVFIPRRGPFQFCA